MKVSNKNRCMALLLGFIFTAVAISNVEAQTPISGNQSSTQYSLLQHQVLRLDGVDDFVDVGIGSNLQPQNLTVEAWIRLDQLGTGDAVVGYDGSDSQAWGRGYMLRVAQDNRAYFRKGSGDGSWEQVISATILEKDAWFHLAATYDGVKMRIYVNGQLAGEQIPDTQGISYENATGLVLGVDPHGANPSHEFLNGVIDEVRIWNIARQESEIQATMLTTLVGSEIGLIGYWNFDNGTANDFTTNGNHGTLVNGATIVLGVPTSVADDPSSGLPKQFALHHNYPNPFNPNTIIQYALPIASEVKLFIFNMLGKKVKVLVDKKQSAGYYTIQWDGRDDAVVPVATGIYFYRLQTEDWVQTKKMMLVR